MKYAKIDPELIRSGLIHSEYAQDIELLAYDMARLGCQWTQAKRILYELIISNLKARGLNRMKMAERMGLDHARFYRNSDG